eukprot:339219-Prorocentrum_minimum.AAC.1
MEMKISHTIVGTGLAVGLAYYLGRQHCANRLSKAGDDRATAISAAVEEPPRKSGGTRNFSIASSKYEDEEYNTSPLFGATFLDHTEEKALVTVRALSNNNDICPTAANCWFFDSRHSVPDIVQRALVSRSICLPLVAHARLAT